jgi:hypothetical protein
MHSKPTPTRALFIRMSMYSEALAPLADEVRGASVEA